MPDETTRQGEMTINEEANLPANWVPLDLPPIIPGVTPAMPSNKTPRYLQGTVPPATQHDSSLVGTAYETPNIPQLTMMPLGVQGSPMTNAGIQSTAVKSAPSSSSSGSAKSELQVPSIFTPPDQTVTTPGPLVVNLAEELANTVFAGPFINFGSFGIDTLDTAISLPGFFSPIPPVYGNGYSGTSPMTGQVTPSAPSEWALFIGHAGTDTIGTLTTPSGWTELYNGGAALGYNVYKNLIDTTLVSISVSITGLVTHGNWSSIMAVFKQQPVVVTSWEFFLPGPSFPAMVLTSGNTLLVCVTGSVYNMNTHPNTVLTDSNGNVYTCVARVANTNRDGYNGYEATQCELWVATNIIGGSGIAINYYNGHAGSDTGLQGIGNIYELSGLIPSPTSAVPTFRALVDADLPVVDVPHGGTDLATLPVHAVLLGEGTAAVGSAAPSTSGYYLKDNGASADPSFAALPTDTDYYQTVQAAGSSQTQETKLNFLSPVTATDNGGNGSTDIAVPVFVASGSSHSTGL